MQLWNCQDIFSFDLDLLLLFWKFNFSFNADWRGQTLIVVSTSVNFSLLIASVNVYWRGSTVKTANIKSEKFVLEFVTQPFGIKQWTEYLNNARQILQIRLFLFKKFYFSFSKLFKNFLFFLTLNFYSRYISQIFITRNLFFFSIGNAILCSILFFAGRWFCNQQPGQCFNSSSSAVGAFFRCRPFCCQ